MTMINNIPFTVNQEVWFLDNIWDSNIRANKVSLGKRLPNDDKYSKYGQKGETDIEIREVLNENGEIIGTVRMEFSGKNRKGVVTLHPQLSITGKGYGTALYQHVANVYNIPVEESFGEIGKSQAGTALWNNLQKHGTIKISEDDIPLRQLLPSNASKVVDENGEPLVVYRATEIDENGIIKTRHKAFYFTSSKEIAEAEKQLLDVNQWLLG